MKRKLLLVLLAVSLAFNLAVIATFGHHWMMMKNFREGPESGPMFKHKFQKMLGLTDQQVEFMEKDREEMRKLMEPMRNELQQKREELFALVDAEIVDTVKIDKLIGEMSLLQSKIEKAVINHSIGVKKNLTPEQRGKFKEFLKKSFKRPPHGERFMKDGEPFRAGAYCPELRCNS